MIIFKVINKFIKKTHILIILKTLIISNILFLVMVKKIVLLNTFSQ